MKTFDCKNLRQTKAAGIEIAKQLKFPSCVYLQGGMGTGKTTLCQSIVRQLGYTSSVTSPTYNLIHEYAVAGGVVYHLDLYRLEDPAELEYLAIADLWRNDSLFLVEWPDNGRAYLPKADYCISIGLKKIARVSESHRTIKFSELKY